MSIHSSFEQWRIPHAAIVSILLLLALRPLATAQSTDTLRVGARVRLHGPFAGPIIGHIRNVSSDTLTFSDHQGRLNSVAWSSLSGLQLSVRRRSNGGNGALIGLALAVAVAGYGACCTEYEDPAAPVAFAIGSVMLGLPAAVIGALIGRQVRTDVWRDVPIPVSSR